MDKGGIILIVIVIIFLLILLVLYPSIYASGEETTPSVENIKLFYTTDTMLVYKVLLGVVLSISAVIGVTAAAKSFNKNI
jgi:hypothetical protein